MKWAAKGIVCQPFPEVRLE